MKAVIKTERLYLNIFNESYANLILHYYIRNKAFLEPWEPKRPPQYYTLEYQKKVLQHDYKLFQSKQMLRYWITKKSNPKYIIGTVCFHNIIRACFYSCFVGYKLDKNEVKNGYMTEALKASINVIFNTYNLHRIEANIMPKNTASLNLVKKLGFKQEGLAKDYVKINGKWEDHIHMTLLNKKI